MYCNHHRTVLSKKKKVKILSLHKLTEFFGVVGSLPTYSCTSDLQFIFPLISYIQEKQNSNHNSTLRSLSRLADYLKINEEIIV